LLQPQASFHPQVTETKLGSFAVVGFTAGRTTKNSCSPVGHESSPTVFARLRLRHGEPVCCVYFPITPHLLCDATWRRR
jgi:hypothetical protein